MAKGNEFSIGLMHEIAIAASKYGWGAKDLAALFSNEKRMNDVLRVIRGSHEIGAVKHVIDCSVIPQLQSSAVMDHEELEIVEHHQAGIIDFYVDKVDLYVTPKQKTEEGANANALMYEFAGKLNTLNINVMEYLLANQTAIPGEWENRYIFFWGTITEVKGLGRHVPHMYYSWRDGKWLHDYCPLQTAQILSEKDCAAMYTGYMPHFSKKAAQ